MLAFGICVELAKFKYFKRKSEIGLTTTHRPPNTNATGFDCMPNYIKQVMLLKIGTLDTLK